jgi:uncharacterized protein YecT (DUF1311 family)
MIATFAALLLAAQEPEWNCENPQAQQEMNYCAGIDFERADAELNAEYRAAIAHARQADRTDAAARLPSDDRPGDEATLRDAQRAWVGFRDAHCRLQGYEARGGSMESMLYDGCRAALTRARTAELRGPNPDCPGDPAGTDAAAINRCMTAELARADEALNLQWRETLSARERDDPEGAARLRTAQRAWLAFRDAHCDSLASAALGVSLTTTANLSCRIDLTEARTRELGGIGPMEH